MLALHFKDGDFWSSYVDIFILSRRIVVLQNRDVCGIYKLSDNFIVVCGLLTLFCAVFLIILLVRCGFEVLRYPPPPFLKVNFEHHYMQRVFGPDSLQTSRYKTREL